MDRMKLNTERLKLDLLNVSSVNLVLDYFIKNEEFLKKYEATKPDLFHTEAFMISMINSDIYEYYQGTRCKFYILKKEEPQRVIGTVPLIEIVRGCFQSCFLGYRLDKDEINKGYMTEAIKAIVDFGFDNMKLHRIEANIMPWNKPSLKVVEKLGFRDEGIAQKYLKINGKWEDHRHMVILNEEV